MIGEDMPAPMGWWAIPGAALLGVLRRCHDGEDPEVVYAEEYVHWHVDHIRAEMDGGGGETAGGEE